MFIKNVCYFKITYKVLQIFTDNRIVSGKAIRTMAEPPRDTIARAACANRRSGRKQNKLTSRKRSFNSRRKNYGSTTQLNSYEL